MENQLIHGFRVLRERPLSELSGRMHELEHEKTGAKLIWLERPEENKTFGIAFTTLPWDDTGVFHILEHSVLNGSDRYPVKEPFVELMKNSLNTFLNAMTFPDKTVYPISSRNDQDFLNLTRVYLDAVFHPLIHSRPEILEQEGWHYEFDQAGQPSYKGVVFNEMKGAMASVDDLEEQALMSQLFPDVCYRFNSGGDPLSIPDLTYEGFTAAHRKYYSPSNSFIFLDGDLDLEKLLSVIDGEYLSQLPRGERIAPPAMQAPVCPESRVEEYELSPGEPEEGRVRLAWGRVAGRFDQREKLIAAQALSDVLCGSNQAPLTKAVLSRQLAEDVSVGLQDGVSQPWMQLEVKNLREEDIDRVRELVYGELARLCREGLDREQLEAALANLEFRMRERDYGSMPQGLILGFNLLESWLYGGDPAQNLEVGDLFQSLRAKAEQGYFEDLLRSLFLENPHGCEVILKPSRTAGEERREKEQARLRQEAASWSPEEKEKKIARMHEFHKLQEREDTPEELRTLPMLTKEDIPQEPERIPLEETVSNGLPVLVHRLPTGGIAYCSLYFDATGLREEEFSLLTLLCSLFGELPTARHTVEQLQNTARLLCGRLDFTPLVLSLQEGDGFTAKLRVSFSALEGNVGKATSHVAELLTETRFEDEKSVRDLLRQVKSRLQQTVVSSGSLIAMSRTAAQFRAGDVAQEHMAGFSLYQWLKDRDENWDWPALRDSLKDLLSRLVRKNALTLSVTHSTGDCLPALSETAAALPEGAAAAGNAVIKPWGKRREGIAIPADISFAVLGGEMGEPYTAAWQLASQIVALGYLWNVIRVRGGAYGTGMRAGSTGLLSCYSYRDPNGAESLASYQKAPDFLRELCKGEPDLTGFLIGTVANLSPLLTPRAKGQISDLYYWQGLSWEIRLARWRQLLNAGPRELSHLADLMETALKDGGVCVVGGQKLLDACRLDTVLDL